MLVLPHASSLTCTSFSLSASLIDESEIFGGRSLCTKHRTAALFIVLLYNYVFIKRIYCSTMC